MKKTFTTAFNRTEKSIKDVSIQKYDHPSKVKYSLAYATDINQIYDDYCRTRRLPLNGQKPIYDENFVKYDSLIEAQKLVDEASSYFAGLPANIRNQYGNSLEKFVLALNSCDDYLVKNGVLKTKEVVKEDVTSSTSPAENPVTEPVNTATTD